MFYRHVNMLIKINEKAHKAYTNITSNSVKELYDYKNQLNNFINNEQKIENTFLVAIHHELAAILADINVLNKQSSNEICVEILKN